MIWLPSSLGNIPGMPIRRRLPVGSSTDQFSSRSSAKGGSMFCGRSLSRKNSKIGSKGFASGVR